MIIYIIVFDFKKWTLLSVVHLIRWGNLYAYGRGLLSLILLFDNLNIKRCTWIIEYMCRWYVVMRVYIRYFYVYIRARVVGMWCIHYCV